MASGRASKSLTPGAHETNGPATLYVVSGRATLESDEATVALRGGQWATIPQSRHNLRADEDTIALLTVAPTV